MKPLLHFVLDVLSLGLAIFVCLAWVFSCIWLAFQVSAHARDGQLLAALGLFLSFSLAAAFGCVVAMRING